MRVLVGLVLCTLALGGYLLFTGRREEAQGGEALLPSGALVARSPDAGSAAPLILVLSARTPGGVMVPVSLLRYESGGRARHFLSGPSTHERADDEAGEALFAALRTGRVQRRLKGALRQDGGARRYGLDEGGLRGRIVLPRGESLRLGDDAPGEAVYAAWEGQGDVLLIEGRLLGLVRAGKDGLRRRSLLPEDLPEDPGELRLGALSLLRRPSSHVVRCEGWQGRARSEEVRAILDLLRSARPRRMLEGGGLPFRGDFPQLSAPVLLTPGQVLSAPATLAINGVEQLFFGLPCPAPGADPGEVYGVRSDGARLCLSAADGARLRPSCDALRERRLVPFPARQIARIRLGGAQIDRGPGGSFTLAGRKVEAGAVLSFLDELGAQVGEPFPEKAARTAMREGMLLLETEAGDRVALSLCAGERCLRRDDEAPLLVAQAAIALVSTDPMRFLVRTLLAVPPAEVTALSLSRGGVLEVAERKEGTFSLVRPTSAPADGVHLARVLSLLQDLRVSRWAAATAQASHGLDALRLSVRTSAGEQVLGLGRATADGCFAQAGAGSVGVLDRSLCEVLARSLAARDLLIVDEARLKEVVLVQGAVRRSLPAAGPVLAALSHLRRGEPQGYGPAAAIPPLLHIELRHTPLALPAAAGSTVAPPEQVLRVSREGGRLTARLDGRALAYALDCTEADLRALR